MQYYKETRSYFPIVFGFLKIDSKTHLVFALLILLLLLRFTFLGNFGVDFLLQFLLSDNLLFHNIYMPLVAILVIDIHHFRFFEALLRRAQNPRFYKSSKPNNSEIHFLREIKRLTTHIQYIRFNSPDSCNSKMLIKSLVFYFDNFKDLVLKSLLPLSIISFLLRSKNILFLINLIYNSL